MLERLHMKDPILKDLFETLASMNAGLDQLTHLLEDKGGLKRQPLHGALHVRSGCFAICGCIN
jgi:hypothetical protein